MNAAEISKLLALMALYDSRRVAEPDIVAWLKVAGDLGYADCETAVLQHYRESTERIMPAHVRERVQAIRNERIRAAGPIEVPEELADRPSEWVAWLQAAHKAIADGEPVPRAIEGAR